MTCEMVGSEIQTVALWRRLSWAVSGVHPAVAQVGAVHFDGTRANRQRALTQETVTSQVSGFVVQITLALGA